MSDHHEQNDTNKRPPQNTHHTPFKKPKPPSSHSHHSFSPETTFFTTDEYDDEEELAAQQLISNLLSSPSQTTPFPFKVRFVTYPYLPLSPFDCSSSYITINGNEETCGSSFSDADSSLMASVDTCGVHGVSHSLGLLRVADDDNDAVWDWGDFLRDED